MIDGLEEDKEYTISIYAVFPQGPSEPVSIVGRTCKFVRLDWIGYKKGRAAKKSLLGVVENCAHKMAVLLFLFLYTRTATK